MKLLNVGCGGNRPQDPHWWNLDELQKHLKPGTPERINLDKEPRYVEQDVTAGKMPFDADSFDGVLASHVVEHLSAHAAVWMLEDCRRILKPGGLLVVSVPDAEYFLKVHNRDTPENAVELFGEPISKDEPWQKSFFNYALFHREHQQILTHDSLKCLLIKAGFGDGAFCISEEFPMQADKDPAFREIEKIMNRRKFSVELVAIKPA